MSGYVCPKKQLNRQGVKIAKFYKEIPEYGVRFFHKLSAPKGHYISAQGNALGWLVCRFSPERA